MIKKIIFVFLLIVNLLKAQNIELVGVPGTEDAIDVIEINPDNPSVIYSMSCNTLWKSKDAGATVQPVYLKYLDGYITDLIIPKNKIIIYGDFYYGYFISRDEGISWEILKEDSSPYLKTLRVNPQNSNIYYIKVKSNELWRSNNEGQTWQKISILPKEITRFEIHPQDTSIIYLVANDHIYKSTNSGISWDDIYVVGTRIIDINLNPLDTNKIFLQELRTLYKSNDGGIKFKQISPVDIVTFKLNPIDTNVIYFSNYVIYNNETGGLYKSTDGGKTWQSKMEELNKIIDPYGKATSPPQILEIAINESNPEEIYMGDFLQKGIFKSPDGGENWIRTNSIFANAINLVVDKNNPGFIAAGNRGWPIIKTNDGGDNWFVPTFDQDPKNIELITRSFDFNPGNKMEGFLASENGLYKTTDGGDNWFRLNDFEVPTYSVFYHKYYPDTIFVNAYLANYASYNHGLSWEKYTNGFPSLNMRFVKTNPTLVYEIRNFGKVYKSNDLGKTWIDKSEGLLIEPETGNKEWISSLEPDINKPEIVYCGQTRGISKTNDGGDNWFRIDSSLIKMEPYMQQPKILLDQYNNERIYVGNEDYWNFNTNERIDGGLYLTEDGCKTWQKVYNYEVTGIFTDEGNPRYIYINTNHGLMKFLDTLKVTDVAKVEYVTPTKFELYQNYPNPFNPSTTIKYFICESANIKLEVFDLLGNKIGTLAAGFQKYGEHTAVFNSENLSSGIYFYRLNSGKQYLAKKMLLLK